MSLTKAQQSRIKELESEIRLLKSEKAKDRATIQKMVSAGSRLDINREDKPCECDRPEVYQNSSGAGDLCYNCAGWSDARISARK